MSGFVAVASLHADDPGLAADVDGLAASYVRVRGEPERRRVASPRGEAVAFGTEGLEPVSETSAAGWAVLNGSVVPNGPLPERPLDRLDGQFALLRHRQDGDQVEIAADPFGMHALFAAERDGRVYASTSALALAAHLGARPDPVGVLTFLRAGIQFGARTQWQGVERLEPGAFLRVGPPGVERGRYWRPERDPAVTGLAFDRAVDHVVDAATSSFAVLRSGGGPAWTDLTGGYDTRLLNVLLERAGVAFRCNVRDEERLDEAFADRLARVVRWELTHLGLPSDWPDVLPPAVPTAVAWGDGNLEALELSWVLWAHQRLGPSPSTLLSAGGGEHFQYAAWKSEFLRAGRSNRAHLGDFVDMRLLKPTPNGLFAHDPTPDVREDLIARLGAWIEPYGDELNTTQLDIAYAYRSTGHFGAYHSADFAYLQARLPFYLKDVFTAAFSTDHRHRQNHRLMRHALERVNPRAAAVTTTKGGPAQPWRPGNVHRFAPYYGNLARKAVNKVSQKMGVPILPTVAHFDPAPLAGRRALLGSLGGEEIPQVEDLRSAALFDGQALQEFLDQAREAPKFDIVMLGRILTVELAMRAVGAEVGG
jgi:hypothetical protein